MPGTPFIDALTSELARSRLNNHTDNFDAIQLGAEAPAKPSMWIECKQEFKVQCIKLIGTIIQFIRPFLRPVKRAFYYYFLPQRFFKSEAEKYTDMAFLYNSLCNRESRDLLVKLFAYRILGYRKVKLPRNHPKYWQDIKDTQQYQTSASPIKIKFMDASLAQYDLKPLGFDFKTYALGIGIACAFVQKQYEYHRGTIHCKAMPGDIAIDAGSCWGETTLYFAHEVGPEGRIIAFEFIPSNLKVMVANFQDNLELAKRIIVVGNPLWNYSGRKLYYVDWGPGSRITENEKQYRYDGICETTTIDDVVAQKGLPRVDFIKMDIEGAEFPALKGAEQTLRTYRPKLAISLYHQLSDFVTIPRWLYELNIGYDFYLDHHTIYENETVLFAIPRKDFAAGAVGEAASQAA